jgi:hypothetical protein
MQINKRALCLVEMEALNECVHIAVLGHLLHFLVTVGIFPFNIVCIVRNLIGREDG